MPFQEAGRALLIDTAEFDVGVETGFPQHMRIAGYHPHMAERIREEQGFAVAAHCNMRYIFIQVDMLEGVVLPIINVNSLILTGDRQHTARRIHFDV